jgi:hypothetical protein
MNPKGVLLVIYNMLAKLLQDLVKNIMSNKPILQIHLLILYK